MIIKLKKEKNNDKYLSENINSNVGNEWNIVWIQNYVFEKSKKKLNIKLFLRKRRNLS